MESIITEFIKPELSILIPVLYAVAEWIKKTRMATELIPLILGGIGVGLSLLYVLATSGLGDATSVLMAVFTAVTQGILCAAACVYANQLIRQSEKLEERKKREDAEKDHDKDFS